MKRWAQMSAVSACFALALACEQQTEVQRQTRDLQEAQKNVAKVTHDLEAQLATARADVARLEEKVALARQGLTDDVLTNQKELTEALKAQEQKVTSQVGEAQREADIHARDSEAALRQLQQTTAPTADAPSAAAPASEPAQPTPIENPDRSELVPVKGGPDLRPEGSVDIDRGTPEPAAPPSAVTPNDPPAPTPAPAPVTTVPPGTTPSGVVPPSDTPPSYSPPSDPPPSDPQAPTPPAPH